MNIQSIMDNVLVKMDTRQKEKYQLTDEVQIEISKGYEFNLRIDRPSMAEIVFGKGLPFGEEILIHHNATHETYEIVNDDYLTKEEKKQGYMLFSIPIDMCFIYKKEGEWQPCNNFIISERIFKPYKGIIAGIEPEQVKNRMYCKKGEYEGKVLVTLVNCDYEVIWHNKKNREERIIRTREREILAIDEGMTKELKQGKYLIGLSPDNCKQLK